MANNVLVQRSLKDKNFHSVPSNIEHRSGSIVPGFENEIIVLSRVLMLLEKSKR